MTEDVLRELIALLRIIPEHTERLRTLAEDSQHLLAETERHEDTRHESLTRLGLAGQTDQLTAWETGLAEEPEEKRHLPQVFVGRDPARL